MQCSAKVAHNAVTDDTNTMQPSGHVLATADGANRESGVSAVSEWARVFFEGDGHFFIM